MDQTYDVAMNLLMALAIGFLVGIERGWSERDEEEGDRTAGIRTFSIIGLLGGISSMLAGNLTLWLLPAAFIAVSAMIIVAHILDVQEDQDVGTTTAFTMMLTFILSAWAVQGNPLLALSTTVIVVTLLGYKPALHTLLRNMEEREIYAFIKLLVMFACQIAGGFWMWKRGSGNQQVTEKKIDLKNPFQLGMAIKFGILLAIILLLSEAVKEWFGEAGIYTLAIVSGLTDVDSITLSLSRMALDDLGAGTASIGIILAAASNTLVKGIIFTFFVGLKESFWLILLILSAIIPGLLVAGFLYL
ncbi:MAG: MgtC/SapB family protein [Cyclonatronaceae bacterium]